MSATGYLLRGRLLTPERSVGSGSVLIRDGVIVALDPDAGEARGAADLSAPGDTIVPGFIDLQVNGFRGWHAAHGRHAIAAMAAALPATGVTGFLPTLISRPMDEAAAFVREVGAVSGGGARVLGAHLEGPFLNPAYRGAHDANYLVTPTRRRIERLLRTPPRMVTLAPELAGADGAIRALVEAGVLVALGHSGASYEVSIGAIDAGARFGTHLFNGMAAFHHRAPGVVGALLVDSRVAVGLIADDVHLHAAALDLAIRALGRRRAVLTTDQTADAGQPHGAQRPSRQAGASATRVVRSNGVLAGSAATMDELVRRVAALPGSSLLAAVEMATLTPARVLALSGRVGRLRRGYVADVTVLDTELRIRLTMVSGEVAYDSTGKAPG